MLNKKALAASVSAPPAPFVEDVFSTYLYTGTGATLAINNGIDLAGKGGLVWVKNRAAAENHHLVDTVRGGNKALFSNTTSAEGTASSYITSFNATGFTLGSSGGMNDNGTAICSWTFREQAKFFDIVTYTGNGTAGRTVAHNLGSAPGMIIIKRTDSAGFNWVVYHRSLGASSFLSLDTTGAAASIAYFNGVSPTSTNFTLNGGGFGNVNASGGTYVAYLFAHDAGGFGTSGTDNVISCGSYSGSGGAGNPITLGYEPQWILVKRTNTAEPWLMYDVMRGQSLTEQLSLVPNATNSEFAQGGPIPTATGFNFASGDSAFNGSGSTYIYMAIRRPMKVPTVGTSVFSPQLTSSAPATLTSLNAPDTVITRIRGAVNTNWNSAFFDRLRGNDLKLTTSSSAAESAPVAGVANFTAGQNAIISITASAMVDYVFKRASGFFDTVCYTGTGSARTVAHNLTVAPELMIVKSRSLGTEGWAVYTAPTGNTKYLRLNETQDVVVNSGRWNNTSPTSSVFTVGNDSEVNGSGSTYVAYLFATCAGVSKVGSYTGTAAAQTINCGFTAGARFVIIKRTDAAGDWYVWDTARGIVSGNDPYLLLNSTAAEVTNTDYIDPVSSGFEISSTAPAAINANGGSFIFMAIA